MVHTWHVITKHHSLHMSDNDRSTIDATLTDLKYSVNHSAGNAGYRLELRA